MPSSLTDHMEDYGVYDPTEDDPYVIPGSTCLRNRLGLTATGELNAAEAALTKITLTELMLHPVAGTFDLTHLQAIHMRLFSDIDDWAGQIRTVDIAKGGSFFLPHRLIFAEAQSLFTQLHEERLLNGLEKSCFGERAGYYLAGINKIHPFREGNGRTQRVLIEQLANLNGYVIDWNAISQDAMGKACREARTVDASARALSRLIQLNTLSITEVGR